MHSVSPHRTIYEYQEVEQEESFQSSTEESSCEALTEQRIIDIRDIRRAAYEKAMALKHEKAQIFPEKPGSQVLQNRVSKIEKVEEDEQVYADAQLKSDESEVSQSEYTGSEASEVIEDLDSKEFRIIAALRQEKKALKAENIDKDERIAQLEDQLNVISDIHRAAITRIRREVTETADRTYFRAAQDRATEVKWYSRYKKWSIAGFTISNTALALAILAVVLVIVLV